MLVTTEPEIGSKTVKQLDEQLDLFQKFGNDSALPKAKKARGLKLEKQRLLNEALSRYQGHISQGGESIEMGIKCELARLQATDRPENDEPMDSWEEEDL